jgi:hypothetical protein
MEAVGLTPANSLDLEPIVARQIDARTGGRIRYLRVEVHGSCVLISGYAPSYYLEQLALAAVQEVLQSYLSDDVPGLVRAAGLAAVQEVLQSYLSVWDPAGD